MVELQRIKLQPGDLARYMNTWREKPKVLNIGAGSRYTGPSPIVKHLYGPASTQTTAALIKDIIDGTKTDPTNRFKVEIRVNEGVFDASRGDGHVDIVVSGIIDGVYTSIHQTDFKSAATEFTHTKLAVYDFKFIPIVSGTNIMLLESSDGYPLVRVIVPSDRFTVNSTSYIGNAVFGTVLPYDFLEDHNCVMGRYPNPIGFYNDHALSTMDYKILVQLAANPTN